MNDVHRKQHTLNHPYRINDVLCGRSGKGGFKFDHNGNKNFRDLVHANKVSCNVDLDCSMRTKFIYLYFKLLFVGAIYVIQ